jgi:hypothetical protein
MQNMTIENATVKMDADNVVIYADIEPGAIQIKQLEPTTVRADGYALGQVLIQGVMHHMQFIRVRTKRGEQVCAGKSVESQANFNAAKRLYDYGFATVKLPGQAGAWICVLHPRSK